MQANVLLGPSISIILAVDRICRGKYCTSCIEGCVNACFRQGNSLLLHHFVNRNTITCR